MRNISSTLEVTSSESNDLLSQLVPEIKVRLSHRSKKGNARDTPVVGLLPRIDSFLATLFIANYQTILLRSTNI